MKSAKEIARGVCPHTLHECEAWKDNGHRCTTYRAIVEYSTALVEVLRQAVRALDYAQSVVENEHNRSHVAREHHGVRSTLLRWVLGREEDL